MNNKIILFNPKTKEVLELLADYDEYDEHDDENAQKMILEKAKEVYLKENGLDSSSNEQIDLDLLEKYKQEIREQFCVFIKKYVDEPIDIKVVLKASKKSEFLILDRNLQIFAYDYKHKILKERKSNFSSSKSSSIPGVNSRFFFRLAKKNTIEYLIQQGDLPYDYECFPYTQFYEGIIFKHIFVDNIKIIKWCDDEVTIDLRI